MDIMRIFKWMGDEAIVEALKEMIKLFFRKTGTHVAGVAEDRFARWTAARFGLKTEDERGFNDGFSTLDPAEQRNLLRHLSVFTDEEMRTFYRITILNEDPAVVARNLKADANLSDPDWARKVTFMYQQRAAYDNLLKDFVAWLRHYGQAAVQTLARGLKRGGEAVIAKAREIKIGINTAIIDSNALPVADQALRSVLGGIQDDLAEIKKIRDKRKRK